MNYGLSYKGSKNSIAEKIIDQLPKAEHFYDLFGGGCAITHCALLSGKYKYIHTNDITDVPKLFLDAINGKFKNEKRWISREDFYKLKDTEPYVRIIWSFGNNAKGYLYSKEIEPYKKALHELCYEENPFERKRKYRQVLKKALELSIAPESKTSQLQSLESLQGLERLQSLERLQRLQSLESLEVTQKSYQDVKIERDSVIYCDIPYKNTDKYESDFNHEEFYLWAEKQKNIFISEYSMPEDRFIKIWATKKRVTFKGGKKNYKEECLFIPR